MISLDKEYRTCDGHKVKIYSTDNGPCSCFPVHGAYFIDNDETWYAASWTEDGKYDEEQEHTLDLIEYNPLQDFKVDDLINFIKRNK